MVGPLWISFLTVSTMAAVPGLLKSLESSFQPSGRMPFAAAMRRLSGVNEPPGAR